MSEDSESSIKEIHCKTAKKFICHLFPYLEGWKPKYPSDGTHQVKLEDKKNQSETYGRIFSGNGWIYRGQWDSRWNLIPRAHRTNNNNNPFQNFSFKTLSSQKNNTGKLLKHIENEIFTLCDFLDVANRAGLNCEYHREVFDILNKYRICTEKRKTFPAKESLKYLAKAQHHGIPTRLLDFTYNPLYAAYFAACEVQEKDCDMEGNIAVWALHIGDTGISHRHNTHELKLIPVSYDGNEYIKNQKGLLLLDSKANCHFKVTGGWKGFEEVLDKNIKKVTLPKSKAKDLLKLLYDQFINPVSLMPTLDKATETIKYYHWLFDDPV